MTQKVVIADDHTLVSTAIRNMVDGFPKYEVLYEVRNGRELLNHLDSSTTRPDLILLDISMPVMNGFETMSELHKRYPGISVLCLSMNDDEESYLKMITLGANGFISKIAKENELMFAMDSIVEKGFYYTDALTHSLFKTMQDKREQEPVLLSDREKELLTHICTEMTYQEIADVMCLSPKTIDGYRNSLFQKLSVKSRVGLAMFAVKEGFYKIT